MIKKTVLLAGCLLLALPASAFDAGFIAGSISQPASFFYGLSAGSGTIVPMVKFEFEGYRIKESGLNSLSAAVKFRPKFGSFAPYAFLGVGSEFAKLNFHFSEYHFYTMVGGGFHIFFSSMFSLRVDLRFIHSSDFDRTRVSGGVFIHL
ncbi:MAG: hypothetical protein NTZ12_04700 [Candidatus Aminicenantes bacterium]|nr:hypothetical protein [Candidatus Aminicenantes bacterium]